MDQKPRRANTPSCVVSTPSKMDTDRMHTTNTAHAIYACQRIYPRAYIRPILYAITKWIFLSLMPLGYLSAVTNGVQSVGVFSINLKGIKMSADVRSSLKHEFLTTASLFWISNLRSCSFWNLDFASPCRACGVLVLAHDLSIFTFAGY